MKKYISILTALSLSILPIMAQPCWQRTDSIVNAAVNNNTIPGAVLCIVHGDSIVHLRAFGNRQVYPEVKPMLTTTIFDLASLSKPTGTAMAVMKLIEENRLSVNDKVSKYIPYYNDSITVAHLLTHTSGLPAYANATRLAELYGSPQPDSLIMHIAMLSQDKKQGSFRYSCLNFISLQRIVEVITGQQLKDYYASAIAEPLGLKHTTYCPPASWLQQIAPTENIKVGKRQRQLLHGVVHDPLARIMNGGNSGNAGLFSNAEDLAKICMFLLAPERYQGPLSPETVHLLTTIPEGYEAIGRTYGWDSQSDYNACLGSFLSLSSYCHTGYTGTSIAIDPERHLAIILLTNRVHPKDKGSVNPMRRKVADEVAMVFATPEDPLKHVRFFDYDIDERQAEAYKPSPEICYLPEPTKANKALFPSRKTYRYVKKHKGIPKK